MLDSGWMAGPPAPAPPTRRNTPLILGVAIALIVAVAVAGALGFRSAANPGGTTRPRATSTLRPGSGTPNLGENHVVVSGQAPGRWDPALVGDAGSAGALSQVFESLTALDAANRVQPALAASWDVTDAGRRVTFQLRDGIAFSDGRPITGDDVRRSWLRVLDPQRPSPLASLLGDIQGANEYLSGSGSAADVGIDATGAQVVVRFRRPAAYFVSAASSPTLAVVPADLPESASGPLLPENLVVSGAYVPESQTDTEILLRANPRYWAGRAPIEQVLVKTSLDDRSPVDVFQANEIDYVPIARDDAAWIKYQRDLGPQLRRSSSLSVIYYGFTTTKPPFDSADVRRAFAMAVDWDRLVRLDDPEAIPATSLVPLGIEGRGSEDFSPKPDLEGARAALAAAGYPNGKGFPDVTLVSSGGSYEEAVASELEQVLGIHLSVEVMPFADYSSRLDSDPPQMWTLDWIADYPHPQDFLGLLLETGSRSNVGEWSNPEFDAAIDRAAATDDPVAQEAAYSDAQRVVRDQVPVIPLRYGDSWALSRDGLLGAAETGVGFLRYASLAWDGR
ncbi:MAG: oligopeptide transport system substrate-binding protein [Chloroflexota bacterium]|jgi:oligopeptide transport system substrate-binding protein|nr:oligopeptide transport system substrate-binding protein [Chloroflexota bacterium]